MNRTAQQLAIRQQITDHPDDSLVVNAVAGSGKSSTGVDCFDVMSPYTQKLAFNKAIAEELKVKAPAHASTIGTFHSFCFGLLRAHIRKLKVNAYKVSNLADAMDLFEKQDDTYTASRLVGLLKNSGLSPSDPELEPYLETASEESGLGAEFEDEAWFEKCIKLYNRSCSERNEIDFDDMLLFCALDNLTVNGRPSAFIDEFQDFSGLQHRLCKQFFGNIYAFGDRNQAIYAFRGADANSFDRGIREWEAKELPLSVSFRCPLEVVRHANAFVPQMTAYESAGIGSVNEIGEADAFARALAGANDASQWLVVCRNNKPLGQLAKALTEEGVEFSLLGQDFSAIERIAKKEPDASAPSILARVRAKLEKFLARPKVREGAREAMLDKQAAVELVFAQCKTGRDILNRIAALTRMRKQGLTLSSIHRSKGLESENVVIWQRSLLPSPRALTPSAIQQERNLEYVAITRARNNLFYFA